MYYPIKGGSTINIQGLECNLPPVGKVFNYFSNEIESRPIYKRSEKPEEQYWEIPTKPKDIKKRLLNERKKRKSQPGYFESDLQEYREKQWDRVVNGFWFMNYNRFLKKSIPTYITGQHYFLLSHWTIKGAAPDYRETDKEWHYFFDYCWHDPYSYGMIEITKRQDGKSVRAGNACYYRTMLYKEKNSGIQSKTDKDAERLFTMQIVNPMKKLEPIFVPTLDRAKGSTPKAMVSFNKTSVSGKDEEYDEDEKELVSQIDFRASSEKAYDGDTLHFYIADECGKSDRANVYRRHIAVIPCITTGFKVRGKMLYTTTVEDIGDSAMYGEGNFRRLWDESNQWKKDPTTNRTISGLYRYFLSSDRAIEWDKYGHPDVVKNRELIQAERDSRKHNPTALVQYIRKIPLEEKEAFYTPGDECVYDVKAIEDKKAELDLIADEDLYIIGNLYWRNGIRGSGVDFVESKNGRLKFNRKFDVMSECQNVNSGIDIYGNFMPLMKHLRCIGVDPFDHEEVASQADGSKAAAYLYFKYNPMSELSETFICEYLNRPADLEEFHEDMCKLAFMSGAELIIENQKQMLINHCSKTGFKQFVYHHGTTPGIPANRKNHLLIVDSTEIYIAKNMEKQIFKNILLDWSKFNLNKTTKFDAAMASGWALVGAYTERITAILNKEKPKTKVYDASGFM